jgi:transposase
MFTIKRNRCSRSTGLRTSEKLRSGSEQLELLLHDLKEQAAQTAPPEPDEPAAPSDTDPPRRKPAHKPLPEALPRDVVEHAAPCACPKCGGSLRPLDEDVTYVPGAFRVTRNVRAKLFCRACEALAQAPAPSLPIQRGVAGPGLLAHVLVAKYCDHLPRMARPRSTLATRSTWIARPWRTGSGRRLG